MIQICGYRKYWTELSQPFAFVLILKGWMDENDTNLWVQEVLDRIESAICICVDIKRTDG